MARRTKLGTCSKRCKGRSKRAFHACQRACMKGRKTKAKKQRRR